VGGTNLSTRQHFIVSQAGRQAGSIVCLPLSLLITLAYHVSHHPTGLPWYACSVLMRYNNPITHPARKLFQSVFRRRTGWCERYLIIRNYMYLNPWAVNVKKNFGALLMFAHELSHYVPQRGVNSQMLICHEIIRK
jgi:hypothetical protein